MKNRFCYFVFYIHSGGYGHSEVIQDKKIKSMKDILAIQNACIAKVEETEGTTPKNLCITHFQLF